MRPTALLPSLLVPALLLPATLVAGPDDDPPAPETAEAAAPSDDEVLVEAMFALKDGVRTLTRGLLDPANDAANLQVLADLQAHVLQVKLLPAPALEEQPEDERAAHAAGFRVEFAKLAMLLLETEVDLLEGRREAARDRVAGPVLELRNRAHDAYKPSRW